MKEISAAIKKEYGTITLEILQKCNRSKIGRDTGINRNRVALIIKQMITDLDTVPAPEVSAEEDPNRYSELLPDGMPLKAVSRYVKGLGWVKGEQDKSVRYLEIVKKIDTSVEPSPVYVLRHPPGAKSRKDIMMMFNIFDAHYGMLAWGAETGFDNYDQKEAERLQFNAVRLLAEDMGEAENCILNIGGDDFHTDNSSNKTNESHHPLSLDSRFEKMIVGNEELKIKIIKFLKNFCDNVIVNSIPGNHDEHIAIAQKRTLHRVFENDPDVIVNVDPVKHIFYNWGGNMFMLVHGHKGTKPRWARRLNGWIIENSSDLPRVISRVVQHGHFHSRSELVGVDEDLNGVRVCGFPSLVPLEGYSADASFESVRAMTGQKWHKAEGQLGEFYATPLRIKRFTEKIL